MGVAVSCVHCTVSNDFSRKLKILQFGAFHEILELCSIRATPGIREQKPQKLTNENATHFWRYDNLCIVYMYYYFLLCIFVFKLFFFFAVYNIRGNTTCPLVLSLCNEITVLCFTTLLFVPEPHGSRHGTQSGPFLHLNYREIKNKVASFPFFKQVSQHEYGHTVNYVTWQFIH